MAKTVSKRYMQAVFKRGKNEYLPLSYIHEQAAKVVSPEELNKIEPVLAEMSAEGYVEAKDDGTYKLLKEIED